MTYKVSVQPLGKKDKSFGVCRISLDKYGVLLVMDADGQRVIFSVTRCRVEVMARDVIIISGITQKPEFVEVFCLYNEEVK